MPVFDLAAANPGQLALSVVENQQLLSLTLEGLSAAAASVRFGCAKAIRNLAETRPDLLYPHFDRFVQMLDHQNTIFQWEAALVLSHLARVDREERFQAIFDRYFAPIPGPVMISAANVIRGGARIALAKPSLADPIAAEILRVNGARYQTPECRNVAIGHAILALGDFFALLRQPAPVVRFVRKQLENPRPATRKKAQIFLKRISPAAVSVRH